MGQKKQPPLFYRELGKGNPLLLLHGLAVNGEMFYPIAGEIAKRNHLIIPDLRGHGRSANLSGPYTPKLMVQDVLGLLDSLRVKSLDVLGYSEGGSLALELAKEHPERVGRLVLVSAYSHGLGALGAMLQTFLAPWMFRLISIGSIADAALNMAGGPRVPAGVVDRFKDMLPQDKDKLLQLFQGMVKFDSRPWLDKIKAQTLIIAGSDDRAAPPKAHAQELAVGIKSSRLELIDGAGHALIFTHADTLAKLVVEFLEKNYRSRSKKSSTA